MIPRTIHYCWFGRNPLPKSAIRCIESWKKYASDYKIVEWNENNFDINSNLYCRQAYEEKKWAFVTDYVRLLVVYEQGGVYLDTDVELIKPIDDLLEYDFFIGRQQGFQVNTGSGFGAIAGHPVLKRMLDDYKDIPFIKENGEMDLWTCPHRNSQCLFEDGLEKEDTFQVVDDVAVFPIEYFAPLDPWTRELKITNNTYSIHHCDGSWNPNETRKEHMKRYFKHKILKVVDYLVHIPNRMLKKILGSEKYDDFKHKYKGAK